MFKVIKLYNIKRFNSWKENMKKNAQTRHQFGFHSLGYGKNNGNIQVFKFDTHIWNFQKIIPISSGEEGRGCCLCVDWER